MDGSNAHFEVSMVVPAFHSDFDYHNMPTQVSTSPNSLATGSSTPNTTDLATRPVNMVGIMKRRTALAGIFSFWATELLSLSISLASLITIVGLVQSRDQRPLPDWPITINALVSVFSSIFKAALLLPAAETIGELKWLWFSDVRALKDIEDFDLASRGPRGSLRFLFRLPENKLACLGALITILAVGSDPLSQLLVQTYDCPQSRDGFAFINRTSNYTLFEGWLGGKTVLDASMSLALYEGALNPPTNATSTLPFGCQSGNCTFPSIEYSSLSMCHTVANISDRLRSDGSWGWHLPSGINVQYHSNILSSAQTRESFVGNFTEDSPLFEFDIITGASAGCVAYNVAFYPCIKRYKEVVIAGMRLQQKLTAETRMPRINLSRGFSYYSLAGDISATTGIDCSPDTTPQKSKTVPVKRLRSGRFYVPPFESLEHEPISDANVAISNDTLWYNPACTWNFATGPTLAIPQALGRMLGVPGKPNNVSSAGYTEDGDPWMKRLYRLADILLEVGDPTPPSERMMRSLTGVKLYAEGIANAMTATISRNGDATNSAPFRGETQVTEICIHFQWEWLVWNLTLLVGTFILLIATSWRSRGPSASAAELRNPWKSSSLALLWGGLEDQIRSKVGALESLRDINRKSKLLKVKLTRLPHEQSVNSTTLQEVEEGEESLDQESCQSEENNVAGLGASDRIQRSGRWALVVQEELEVPEKQKIAQRLGYKFSQYVPVG